MQCAVTGANYTVYGYKGKQVRDNIHSHDLVNAFYHFYLQPRSGEVYDIGGSRHSNCLMREAIKMCEEITGKRLRYQYREENRSGDHIWYISGVRKFQSHYPGWTPTYDIESILREIYCAQIDRHKQPLALPAAG
jgi:CDP-paratose 2-epimerase